MIHIFSTGFQLKFLDSSLSYLIHIFPEGSSEIHSNFPMLQVVSAISGEDLVVLNTEELEGRESSKSEALKAQLAEIVGVSRFRLRLFREDNSEVQGDDEITEKMLKLVILEFLPFCENEHEETWISACRDDDAQGLQRLLDGPLNPDLSICKEGEFKGCCPLHIAAKYGSSSCVRLLLQACANKELEAQRGLTPLHFAAQNGHMEVIRFLIEAGSDKDKADNSGSTPLAFAAFYGHMGVVRFLIEAGSDKDKADNCGSTPLHFAALNGYQEMVRFLIEAGSDKDKADNSG